MELQDFLELHHALMALSRDTVFVNAERRHKLASIAEFSARALGISRVSIWRLDPAGGRIDCEVLFSSEDNHFLDAESLHESGLPVYFSALRQHRLINADDARTDRRTAEFTQTYLLPNQIHSMLDVPVFNGGELAGTLCMEQKTPRRWQIAEMAFATSVADLVSLINLYDSWQSSRQEVEFLHHRDLLTRLENRGTFQRRMENDLHLHGEQSTHALVLIGIDGFKGINDTYGYQMANHVLVEFGNRLQALCFNRSVTVARIGGDVFALWSADIQDVALMGLLSEIQNTQSRLFTLPDSSALRVSFTSCVTVLPVPGFQGADPMRCGEFALSKAKAGGRGSVTFFDKSWVEQLNLDQGLDAELSLALVEKQIVPHYQPIVSALNGEVVGIEALVRWQRSSGEIMPPNAFLPRIAELGLLPELGRIVVAQACRDLALLMQTGSGVKWVAVNIAGEQLSQPDFLQQMLDAVSAAGLKPDNLRLEVVEELIARDNQIVQQNVANLRATGLRVSIDDFGTGYSSLARLKQLPISNLKIDRTFVAGLPDDNDDQCIARSILGLAQGLGKSVTAEGIETPEQARWLKANGCNFFQGFLISRPLPYHALVSWLAFSSASPQNKAPDFPDTPHVCLK